MIFPRTMTKQGMKNFRQLQILNNRLIHSMRDSNSDQQNLLDALQKLKKPALFKETKLTNYQNVKIQKTEYPQYEI